MKCLSVFIVLAVIVDLSLGLSFRHKRQLSDDEDENTLDDRYGWNRPAPDGPQRPQPNQGGNPWERPNGNQGNQWPRPNQGGNQGPQPNQGGNQWQRPDGNQENQWPQPNQGGNQPQPTPAPNGNGSTTTQSSAVQECIRNCPVTSEYNPVCGTNNVQYTNPGRLTCAQTCGVNVSLMRASPCPSTTTAAPNN